MPHEYALVCIAGTRALNPTWDPTGEIERDLREQDPDAAAREIDAEPLAGGAGTFLDPAAIAACVDKDLRLPLPAPAGTRTHFGSDLGFSSDCSANVGTAKIDGKLTAVSIQELRPRKGAPLKPKTVIDTFAETMKLYGAAEFVADPHYKESAKEHLEPHGIRFVDAPSGDGRTDAYLLTRKVIHECRVRLPNHARLLSQLRSIVSRPRPGGGMSIEMPRRFGAHGDIASAFVLSLWHASHQRAPAPRVRLDLAKLIAGARGIPIEEIGAGLF